MTRLLFYAVIASLACKLLTGAWPWHYMNARSSRAQALLRARTLLALREDANRNDIIEAHKRLVAMVHPDRGGTSEQVHEANAARDLLLDELPD
jgi:hypothetical protein